MKFNLVIIIIIGFSECFGQTFCGKNSSPNPNYCCGHDPNLSNFNSIYTWQASNNFCDISDYEIDTRGTMIYKSGDWILVWNDQFDTYSTFNGSFYVPSPSNAYNTLIANDNGTTPNSGLTRFMIDPALVRINQNGNGKLQLFERWDPNPSTQIPIYQWGVPAQDGAQMHSDFAVGYIETKMHFPDGLEIEADIKTYPMNTKDQWPAFWTYGNNGLELDIFEMPYESGLGSANNSYQILTYHAKKFGGRASSLLPNSALGHEAVKHRFFTIDLAGNFNNIDLSEGFHTYRLIWDDWILQWRFDDIRTHSVHRFYRIPDGKSNNYVKKHYRAFPIHSATDWSNHSGKYFINKHFPTYYKPNKAQDALSIIFQNGLKDDGSFLSPAIDPNSSMDMEYLKVWVKTDDCGKTRTVNSENISIPYPGLGAVNYGPGNVSTALKRNYLETGGVVLFAPGNNVTIEWSQIALFVATEEISFQDGFTAEHGSELFSFITVPCVASNNNRFADLQTDTLLVAEHDSIPYYHQNGEIDTTIIVPEVYGGRYWNPSHGESNGILYATTEASKENKLMNRDILLKTNVDGFSIESQGSKIYSVELFDSKASLIRKYSDPNQEIFQISRTNLAEGVYTCIIYTSAGIEVRKIWVWQ